MSRLGKKPVLLPQGVTGEILEGILLLKSGKGTRKVSIPNELSCEVTEASVCFEPKTTTCHAKASWGLLRSLTAGAVRGLSEGIAIKMRMEGVGYKVALEGNTLKMQLGFSHDVLYPLPEGVSATVEAPTQFTLRGVCPQRVGQTMAEIQAYRPPEPFKGKGLYYEGQYVRRKEGKKK